MKQFKFRLARLQKLRERVREQRRIAHAEAIEYQRRIESNIEQVKDARIEEKNKLRDNLADAAVSIDRVIQSRVYDVRLVGYGVQLNQQLGQIQQVVAARRQQLVLAERDVKVLEKLEVKAHERYDTAANKADLQLLDELAIQAANRRLEITAQQRQAEPES